MKLAISTSATARWSVQETIACAKRLGVEGVELDSLPDPPDVVARAARDAGIELACLGTRAAFADRDVDDLVSGGIVRAAIDVAREMGCRLVRMSDIAAGRAREAAVVRFGEFLLPLADYALERAVTLVVENALSLRTARAMWGVMDRLSHPALGVCWDAASARAAGETPYQSVPVLNSRIRHVHVRDVGAAGEVQPGGGEAAIAALVTRLRGVGYAGFLSLSYRELPEPEVLLAEAARRVRGWARPAAVKGKGPVVAKAASRGASDAAPAGGDVRV